jgi:hypothetical protein
MTNATYRPPKVTLGMLADRILVIPVLFVTAAAFARQPGWRTGMVFFLANLMLGNVAYLAGKVHSIAIARELWRYLRASKGSGLTEIEMEQIAAFARVREQADWLWWRWKEALASRWERSGYALNFRPVRAYVVHPAANSVRTGDKAFHTHEGTSFLFFRTPPSPTMMRAFSQFNLLHEIGHVVFMNPYTVRRRADELSAAIFGATLVWAMGGAWLTLAVLGIHIIVLVIYFLSHDVQRAHELTADLFAYRELTPEEVNDVARLLRTWRKHIPPQATASLRQLADSRVEAAETATRLKHDEEELPLFFPTRWKPAVRTLSLAAAATVLIASPHSEPRLLPILVVTVIPLLLGVPLQSLTWTIEKKNVAEIAHRVLLGREYTEAS